jgi:hypothetical protein
MGFQTEWSQLIQTKQSSFKEHRYPPNHNSSSAFSQTAPCTFIIPLKERKVFRLLYQTLNRLSSNSSRHRRNARYEWRSKVSHRW